MPATAGPISKATFPFHPSDRSVHLHTDPIRIVRLREINPLASVGTVPITLPAEVVQGPANLDLACYSGDDFQFTISVHDPDGSPSDFSATSFLAQIRGAAADPVIVAAFVITVDNNFVTLKLQVTDSQNLDGDYVWDLQGNDSRVGLITTYVAGALKVNADVSH
jgi:hypothetical protein